MHPSKQTKVAPATKDDNEIDEWDERISNTGCSVENQKLTDCYFEKKDWRLCQKEMDVFRACWKKQGNDQRTDAQKK